MKNYLYRIAVLAGLIVVFVTLFIVVDAAMGDEEIQFGYWVNLSDNEDCRNFVILGTDKEGSRTDLILFCQYSPKTGMLNALQIPRDTKIDTNRADKKINSVYGAKGISEVKNAVEKITGIYPDNYVVLNLKGFRQMVDALGGIEYNVPIRMKYTDPVQKLKIDLMPGQQTLSGKEAEMFMRFRKNDDGSGYAEGDIGRLKAHKGFYQAVIDKALSLDGLINMGSVMKTVGDNLKTDFTLSDLFENIDGLKKLNRNSVNVMLLPGNAEYINNISYYIADGSKTKELTQKYFKNYNIKGR